MARRQTSSGALRGTMDLVAAVGGDSLRHLPLNRSARTVGRINLKAVAEVLASRGLDPTEAIIDILQPVDENGNPVPSRLDADVQARILNELLQYTQPKLKSVEIRAKVAATSFDVNDAQAKRIAEEFLKAAKE